MNKLRNIVLVARVISRKVDLMLRTYDKEMLEDDISSMAYFDDRLNAMVEDLDNLEGLTSLDLIKASGCDDNYVLGLIMTHRKNILRRQQIDWDY